MAPASRGAPGPAFGPVPAGPDFNKTSSRRGPGVKRGSLASPAHDHAACPSRARAPAEKSKCHRTSSGGYLLFMGWTRQGDAAGCCRWRRLLLLGTESSPSVMDTNERPRWLLLPHCPNCLSPAGSSPPLPQFVLSRLACRPSSPRPAAHRTRARAHTHRHGRWTERHGGVGRCSAVGLVVGLLLPQLPLLLPLPLPPVVVAVVVVLLLNTTRPLRRRITVRGLWFSLRNCTPRARRSSTHTHRGRGRRRGGGRKRETGGERGREPLVAAAAAAAVVAGAAAGAGAAGHAAAATHHTTNTKTNTTTTTNTNTHHAPPLPTTYRAGACCQVGGCSDRWQGGWMEGLMCVLVGWWVCGACCMWCVVMVVHAACCMVVVEDGEDEDDDEEKHGGGSLLTGQAVAPSSSRTCHR